MDLFPDLPGAQGPPEPLSREPGPIRFGTSSFSNRDWVGPFYPPGTQPRDFLRAYARRYDTVEIDATYYGVPAPGTAARWARAVPEGFLVAAKFPREIVHGGAGPVPDPGLVLDPDETYAIRDAFLDAMALLGAKLGPLLLQFPYFPKAIFPSAGPFLAKLDRFLRDLPPGPRVVVEIRNRAWLTPRFTRLLAERGAALALTDHVRMPHADELDPGLDPVTAGFAYVRLLGDHREMDRITSVWNREVVDRSPRLRRWAEVLVSLLERNVPALVYVNNHYAGYAPGTLDRLRTLIREAMEDNDPKPRF